MTNWVYNTLTVTGTQADLNDFRQWLGDGWVMPKIHPLPEGLPDTPPDDPAEREALKDRFGVDCAQCFAERVWDLRGDPSWDDCQRWELVDSAPGTVRVLFESPTWPKDAVVAEMACTLFPHLQVELTYNALMSGFSGRVVWRQCAKVEDRHHDYPTLRCGVCAHDVPATRCTGQESPVAPNTCLNCLPAQPDLYTQAEVLLCSDDPQVLDALHHDLSASGTLNEMLGMSGAQIVQTTFGTLHDAHCEWLENGAVAHVTDAQTAETLCAALPAQVSWTDGGSLLIRHTTPRGPQGQLWVDLSARYPQVTFYVSCQTPDDPRPDATLTVVSGGQVYRTCATV